jgi:PhnB protein
MAKVKAVPTGMHTLTPQLSIHGDGAGDGAAAAIEFYKRAFGAEEISRAIDPSGKKVWHAALRIGDSTFFVNDTFEGMDGANKSSLWIYLDGVDAAFQRAIDAGAQVKMPVADMFWGDRLGALTDKWGNQWTIAQRVKDMTEAEQKKAGEEFAAQMRQQPPKK